MRRSISEWIKQLTGKHFVLNQLEDAVDYVLTCYVCYPMHQLPLWQSRLEKLVPILILDQYKKGLDGLGAENLRLRQQKSELEWN
jgi:hypothetical protein